MTEIPSLVGFGGHASNCSVLNCTHKAVYEVGALVWASGMRKGSHEPLALQAALFVCEDHKGFPTVKNLFTPAGQKQIVDAVVKAGRRAPDFATAEILLAPIGGKKVYLN